MVPFATLPTSEEGELLGARYAIRFTPSLATLAEVEAIPGGSRPGERPALPEALVVGNPGMPEVSAVDGPISLSPLPGAEAEGRWVADLVATDLLTGPGATEGAVREQLPGASLIHLATHGFAYSTDARARDSFVALAPEGEHDGLLTVGEVLDDPTLELSAELVVLSACQTGLGDLRQSEGTVGLQRAFLARGARSVLVSLWSVSDQATDLLMRGFYRHWLEDDDAPSKAEALRRAQKDVRATPGFEHPRFWAAFQLVGAR
jgi:CHAT domain-containing protein